MTTTTTQIEINPFALMMDPQAVLAAVARSERLGSLNSRICRPLDKPLIARVPDDAAEFDELVEAASDTDD